MSQRGPRQLITALVAIWLATPALAVDSWLVADKHIIKPGGEAWIAFITGDVFPIGDGIVDPTRIDGLIDLHDNRQQPIDGLQIEDDAVAVRQQFDSPGFHILGLSLKPRVIALDSDLFGDYLQDERAVEALTTYRQKYAGKTTVRERYTKYAKTIIEVGASPETNQQFLKPLGQRLEIVPLSNPTRWQAGDEVGVKVLLDGHPWPNVSLTAAHEGTLQGEVAVRTRTDEHGTARWRLTQSGQWFARAHFIRPVNGLVNYEWESFWTTFSFGVKGKADVTGSMQLLRAIHGDINPWAVAGYLMGERALSEHQMAFGSDRLLALHHCPQKLPYTAVLDGIQAATGATVGKLNLRLIPASESELRCEFIDMESGRKLTYQFQPAMFDQMVDAKDGEARALALQMMTLPESDIFIANASTSDQATPAKDEARNVQPASDVNERDKPKIKSVNLQAMGDTGRDALPEASPIRLNIPSLAVNVPPARPLQVVSQEVNKSDETGETPKDKIALIEKSKERMQAGPGEVFWRLAHHHHAGEPKGRPFPSRDLPMPEALANGR